MLTSSWELEGVYFIYFSWTKFDLFVSKRYFVIIKIMTSWEP